jgi:hypothetical protein
MEGHDGMGGPTCDIGSLGDLLRNDSNLDEESSDDEDLADHVGKISGKKERSKETHVRDVMLRVEHGGLFNLISSMDVDMETTAIGDVSEVSQNDRIVLDSQALMMKHISADKRPRSSLRDESKQDEFPSADKRRRIDIAPKASLSELRRATEFVNIPPRDDSLPNPATILEDIIDKMGFRGNAEQERALRIICEHFISGSQEQLMMHIGGVGGSGKSHVT